MCLQCRRPQFDSWLGKICWRRERLPTPVFLGFPCGSAGKESAYNVGDLGLTPGLRISPGEGKGYPLHYSGLGNSEDCKVHGSQRVGHSWVTFTFTFRWLVRPRSNLIWFPFSYLLEQEVLEQQQISCAWHCSIQMSAGTERITQNPRTNWVPMISTSSTQWM